MITEELKCELTTIDNLILQKQPFAVYRIPGAKGFRLLRQRGGTIRQLKDLKELNGERGFVIAPFQVSEERPIVLLQPDEDFGFCTFDDDEQVETGTCFLPDGKTENRRTERYSACFHTFLEALQNKTFEKLVLSRSIVEERLHDFSPAAAFRAACHRYVHSYVYLCYTPQTGVWLGSTPEIILSGRQGEWNTVALAGTQSLQNGELPQVWDEKNREEQAYVTAYIRRQLHSLGIEADEKGPYPAYAGALSHLKTDFRFSLSDPGNLGGLLEVLHPTPAVCGLPKEEAYRFILGNEGYDRKYYSGFIGWLDPEGQTDLYVNLRCMNIEDDRLVLYAGGGLLASSEVDDEWMETEKKLQTMKCITLSSLLSKGK